MTQMSRDDIVKLAKLSGLQLNGNEIDTFRPNIEAIIGYFDQLEELDTKGVEPTYQVTGLLNVFRHDEVDSGTVIEGNQLVRLAADTSENFIKVPKVL